MPAADMNDTFNAVADLTHYNSYVSAAQVQSTSGNFDTAKSYTLPNAANSLLVGLFVECQIRNSKAGEQILSTLKIQGPTLGKHYVAIVPPDPSVSATKVVGMTQLADTTNFYLFRDASTNVYSTVTCSLAPCLLLPDANTIMALMYQVSSGTASIQHVTIRSVYKAVGTADP